MSVSVRRSHPQPQGTSSACSSEVVPTIFCKRIGVWLLWRSIAFRDCAVLRGRTQSILGELWIGFLLEDSSLEIEKGTIPCPLEDFGRVFGRILVVSIQPQRRALEDSVDPQGGDFRGSAISEMLSRFFWVW